MAPITSFISKFTHAAFTLQPHHHHRKIHAISSATSEDATAHSLSELCNLFSSQSNHLYLSSSPFGRGVFVKDPISQGDVVFSIPISNCFRDDQPPDWFEHFTEDDDVTDYERYNPSAWAIRLAASLLDMELGRDDDSDVKRGRELWKELLPEKEMLRASLPVHWNEELIASTKCTELEVAVDNAFFWRGNAVLAIADKLGLYLKEHKGGFDEKELKQKCEDALDMVQTRACRVERKAEDGIQWGPPLRLLAPIFDFINHASSMTKGKFMANAEFNLEGEKLGDLHNAKLVVRAIKDIPSDEEVLIDYGDSARPAWKCLNSYGFVPEYDPKNDVTEDGCVENVAELWMNGLRFDVDPHSIPFDLVEVGKEQAMLDGDLAIETDIDDEALSPAVVKTIAKRSSEAALHLLLVPDISDEDDSPEFRHSTKLAVALRKSQYNVLEAFTDNLKSVIS
jgi:hypothetical protein